MFSCYNVVFVLDMSQNKDKARTAFFGLIYTQNRPLS